jgi:hypothetical protein
VKWFDIAASNRTAVAMWNPGACHKQGREGCPEGRGGDRPLV